MSEPSTCQTCRHWLPRETPPWAARQGMAICALKQTKAVTMSHWLSCRKHEAADACVVADRSEFYSVQLPDVVAQSGVH